MNGFDIPVAIIVFNRLDRAKDIYGILEKIKPTRLYIISDGARNSSEKQIVDDTRRVFSEIDWECDVYTDFSKTNLGCDKRIITGLDWVFSRESKAIILEDDCYPDETFFLYCKELLEKYEYNKQISYISGTNMADISNIEDSYYFSYRSSNWGWATWSDRWKSFDRSLNTWNKVNDTNQLFYLYPNKIAKQIIDEIHRNFCNPPYPWDFLWWIDSVYKGKMSITPKYNLIINLGFESNATHTAATPFFYKVKLHSIDFPIKHPKEIKRCEEEENKWLNLMVETPAMKIKRRVKRLLNIIKNGEKNEN